MFTYVRMYMCMYCLSNYIFTFEIMLYFRALWRY